MTLPLSAAMREGSAAEHRAAESSAFVTRLLAGEVGRDDYAAYLRCLRLVYATLEDAVRHHADHPWVAAVHDPALERLAALDADLDHWAPHAPRTTGSPAAHAYAARVRAAGPGGLLAHHYTRYLGDLSGGQAIGRVLDRAYHLGGAGLAFYDFAAVPRPKPYKDAFRARLDALALPPAAVAEVVAEVRVAFGHNRRLFAELGDESREGDDVRSA